jgi:hypothetical protein
MRAVGPPSTTFKMLIGIEFAIHAVIVPSMSSWSSSTLWGRFAALRDPEGNRLQIFEVYDTGGAS